MHTHCTVHYCIGLIYLAHYFIKCLIKKWIGEDRAVNFWRVVNWRNGTLEYVTFSEELWHTEVITMSLLASPKEIGFHLTYEMSYLFSVAFMYMLLLHILLSYILGSIYELSSVFHWSLCLNQNQNIMLYAWTQGNYDISDDL